MWIMPIEDAAVPLTEIGPMTQEQYDAWCFTTELRTEFVDGRVIVMSPESVADEEGRWFLGSVLRTFVEERDLGKVYGPNLQIRPQDGRRRVPDLIFIASDNLGKCQPTHVNGVPDLAVEIVSPDSEERDRVDKFAEYAKSGVKEFWTIHIPSRRFEAFRLGPNGYVPIRLRNGIMRSRVVPGFWFRVDWLWQSPPPKLTYVQRELGLI